MFIRIALCQHDGFGRPMVCYSATGYLKPACCHKAIVVMRMGALDCLHDFTVYVLRSLLCGC